MKHIWKKAAAGLLAVALAVGAMPAKVDTGGFFGDTTIIAHASLTADKLSENISLVANEYKHLTTISGTHYSVSCGYSEANENGMKVNSSGDLTIKARKDEMITKVVLTYSSDSNKDTLSASAGTFDGDATISNIHARQVTIKSSSTTGVQISAVTVYFWGRLSDPTVTLTGGANARSSGGLLTQIYLPGAMDTVIYTARTGAAFPAFESFTQNGVTVERTSDTVVTISGTPTANTEITVPDAESSSKLVTWDSSVLNGEDFKNLMSNTRYSDTKNGITLKKSGNGGVFFDSGSWMFNADATLTFTTATGSFTNIEIETSTIYDGGNWTADGNTLKWNGTPSNSVSLSGSNLYLYGVSSVNFVIEMRADLSDAAVMLNDDNTVYSVAIGANEITDLSEFDITYGATAETATTDFPTAPGKYYAFVTAKADSKNYTGTATSEQFIVNGTLTDGNYKQTASKDGTYYTRFVFVRPLSELEGKSMAAFTIYYAGRATADPYIYETNYYYTSMVSDGITYTPASKDSVLLVVTVSSGMEISNELKCNISFESASDDGGAPDNPNDPVLE